MLSPNTIPEKLSRLLFVPSGQFLKEHQKPKMLSFLSTIINGKEVVFNFFSKIISAGQAQLKNVFSYDQLPEYAQDFCPIQVRKESQVFNGLIEKMFKSWNLICCIKQASNHTIHKSVEKQCFITQVREHFPSCPDTVLLSSVLFVRLQSTVAHCDGSSPLQVLGEPSTVLSQFTY